jgi:hypothetical protein
MASYAPIYASAFTVQSTRAIKSEVRSIRVDPLAILLDPTLHGISYTDIPTNSPKVGFVAEAWEKIMPELVAYEVVPVQDGERLTSRMTNNIFGMDYGAVGAITFEALKLYVDQTDTRLEQAEARIAELEARVA